MSASENWRGANDTANNGKILSDSETPDSGFISSSSITFSSDDIQPKNDNYKLPSDASEELRVDPKLQSDDMRTMDSGYLDQGISESFSEMCLRTGTELNDLDTGKKRLDGQQYPYPVRPWQYYFERDQYGDTPLHVAVVFKYEKAVSTLLRVAPDAKVFDLKNNEWQTSLYLAVATNQPHIARQLILAGANPNIRASDGNTPLTLAARSGDLHALKLLTAPIVQAEVDALGLAFVPTYEAIDVNITDLRENAVHLAINRGHVDMVKYLVSLGADLNVKENLSGQTPLHLACAKPNTPQILDFFLNECSDRIDFEATSYDRRTAYDYCCDQVLRAKLHAKLVAKGVVVSELDDDESSYYSDSSDEY